jgi:hypothetical protein
MKTREEIINSMCYTWRHDFGLDKDHDSLSSGMTAMERVLLWNAMAQIFDNDISPLLDEANDIQSGNRIVLPKTQEQAEAMLAAAEFYLNLKNENWT